MGVNLRRNCVTLCSTRREIKKDKIYFAILLSIYLVTTAH